MLNSAAELEDVYRRAKSTGVGDARAVEIVREVVARRNRPPRVLPSSVWPDGRPPHE